MRSLIASGAKTSRTRIFCISNSTRAIMWGSARFSRWLVNMGRKFAATVAYVELSKLAALGNLHSVRIGRSISEIEIFRQFTEKAACCAGFRRWTRRDQEGYDVPSATLPVTAFFIACQ